MRFQYRWHYVGSENSPEYGDLEEPPNKPIQLFTHAACEEEAREIQTKSNSYHCNCCRGVGGSNPVVVTWTPKQKVGRSQT